MDKNLEELMVQNPVLGLLDAQQQAAAIQCAFQHHYQKHAYLTFYGDSWPYLFMLTQGLVDGVKESPEGRQLIVRSLRPGDIFWGLAFFTDEATNPVSLLAITDIEIFRWSRDDLLPILQQNSNALWRLCQQMTQYMQHASQIVDGLAFQPVAGRLARLLLDQFSDSGQNSMDRNLTLDQLAAKIGTTREQVCRALYQFSDRDLIHITRTEFTLINADGLAQVAGQP
ncbi:MAG: Crp/Fnr family transcriptional regulator [Anaerolineae bacterium]|nr:Crp/Fnr family transcriptional regulator [Anaerolineae bacterium]